LIEVKDVVYGYPDKPVLRGLTLAVAPGEVVGLLGRNGAGKTTTLELLLGLRRPQRGVCRVLGADVTADPVAARRAVGFVAESPVSLEWLTGGDHLRFVSRVRGLREPEAGEQIAAVLARVGLVNEAHHLASEYSMGMRQRLGLAMALLGEPPVLLLDEPTNGLDPPGAEELITIVRDHARAGGAGLISSHQLDIIDRACDRVLFLSGGVIADEVRPAEEPAGARELARRFVTLGRRRS
jgi:ABC-2 type transport system ATP-binding protein